MKSHILNLPTPSSISYNWNFGSLLGTYFLIQFITGFLLSTHYSSMIDFSFEIVANLNININFGWLIRFLHANGATFFFLFIYMHMMRGLYYYSFTLMLVWTIGVIIYFLFMAVAFLGYVLPWGQMSYWGATVITNLISSIPFGDQIVQWVWGGFCVSEPTLTRFFSLHYSLPMLGMVFIMLHLLNLHNTGSTNPLGLMKNSDKSSFHPYFTYKDLLSAIIFISLYMYICLKFPHLFMDPENFIKANPMSTPEHIQPEWYFLFAYAILRSVPNKVGGVILMFMSLMILFIFPFMISNKKNIQSSISMKFLMNIQFFIFLGLTWLGSLPVEEPFYFSSTLFTISYFVNFMIILLFA